MSKRYVGGAMVLLIFTRNKLRSVKFEDDYITLTMRLMGPAQKPFNPELMHPFGCQVVVHMVELLGPQTFNQVVGFYGMLVGYGAMTGHGGAFRVLNPANHKVYTPSYNHCTVNKTVFPWRLRQEWIDRRMELPVSISPTPEAFTDADELAKYDFQPDEIMEVATQLQDDFDYDFPRHLCNSCRRRGRQVP